MGQHLPPGTAAGAAHPYVTQPPPRNTQGGLRVPETPETATVTQTQTRAWPCTSDNRADPEAGFKFQVLHVTFFNIFKEKTVATVAMVRGEFCC